MSLSTTEKKQNPLALLPGLLKNNSGIIEDLKDLTATKILAKRIGLYFSGSWCGPCKKFTPKLIEYYQEENKGKENKEVEIILVSACSRSDEFENYFKQMPWLAAQWNKDKAIQEWALEQGIKSIPTLVWIKEGQVETMEGVKVVTKWHDEKKAHTCSCSKTH